MKLILSLAIAFFAASHMGYTQKISVVTHETEIEKINRKGLSTNIELEKKGVEKAWVRLLKEWGKVESSKGGIYTVKAASLPTISKTPVNILSKVTADTKGTEVFYAIDLGDEYLNETRPAFDAARKILYEFAVAQYREDLNEQIAEADKVVDVAVKLHDKKVSTGESLEKQLERNAQEKIKLQKALEENAQEAEKLKNDIAQNQIEQETALEEIKKVRKVSEEKKAKLSTIQ